MVPWIHVRVLLLLEEQHFNSVTVEFGSEDAPRRPPKLPPSCRCRLLVQHKTLELAERGIDQRLLLLVVLRVVTHGR